MTNHPLLVNLAAAVLGALVAVAFNHVAHALSPEKKRPTWLQMIYSLVVLGFAVFMCWAAGITMLAVMEAILG